MANIDEVKVLISDLSVDRRVPRNIRASLQKVLMELGKADIPMTAKINSAVSLLDEVSNDPNIPPYTRTQIWNIVSMLESVEA